VGNKCLNRGEAKNTYGTGAFLLFNTGHEPVKSKNGLITTVAYQAGPEARPLYALEGSSELIIWVPIHCTDVKKVAVAGSAITWLRDGLKVIENASDINTLAAQCEDTGGVYFVTAFSGLLAPYWDPSAGGLLIGNCSHTLCFGQKADVM